MWMFLASSMVYFISASHLQYPDSQPFTQIVHQKFLDLLLSREKLLKKKNLCRSCHAVLQMHGFAGKELWLFCSPCSCLLLPYACCLSHSCRLSCCFFMRSRVVPLCLWTIVLHPICLLFLFLYVWSPFQKASLLSIRKDIGAVRPSPDLDMSTTTVLV